MRLLLLIGIVLLLPVAGFADVKIIELKHRPAAELLSQVRELLDDNEKAQAAGSHMVLIADGESLQAAEKLLSLLDRPAVNLLIRVKQTTESQQAGKDTSASVRYGNKSGLSTSAGAGFRSGNSTLNQEQSLLLAVGGRGRIEVGRDIPFTEQWSALTGDITGYSEKTAYANIATGFWVYPIQLQAEQVLVEIEPYISDVKQGAGSGPLQINYAQLKTRLLVPLAQWYPLGRQLKRQNDINRAIISWRSTTDQADRELQIRIEKTD